MSENFWIRRENQVNGPYSVVKMRELVSASKISPDDEISKDRKRWIVASRVRALKLTNGNGNGESKRPKNSNNKYWIRHSDEAFGPYTSKELKELAQKGLLQMDDLISLDRHYWSNASTSGKLPLSVWGSSTENPVVYCPECSRPQEPGVIRCTACHTCLRPTFLGVCTIVWLVFNSLSAFGYLFMISQDLRGLIGLMISIVGIFVSIGLRYGKYWAWIGIQVIWVVCTCIFLVMILIQEGEIGIKIFGTAIGLALAAFLFSPWWIYFYNDRVKAFCSA